MGKMAYNGKDTCRIELLIESPKIELVLEAFAPELKRA